MSIGWKTELRSAVEYPRTTHRTVLTTSLDGVESVNANLAETGRDRRSAAGPGVIPTTRPGGAFTLIELLLVMTIMVAAIGIVAPTLAGFFRGRTLDSEARRLLALAHSGQNRAVSEGIPTRLWLDSGEHTYGLEQDPGWSDRDPKALEFAFDKDVQIEVVHSTARSTSSRTRLPSSVQARANLRNLPEIRFLPDGSIDETSPLAFHLQDRSGTSLWLAQSTNHLSYEIRDSYQ